MKEAWHILLPDTPYIPGLHIDLLCDHLEAITSGKLLAMGRENRLLFNVPPGTMKSLLVSVFWPAWEWGPQAMLHLQIITTSHRMDFCVRDSNRFRKLVQSDWYQQRWPMTFTKSSETKIENSRGGFREAMPFNKLTGGRGDRVIVDDPHSLDGAESELELERTIRNFRESVTLRLNDPKRSAIVVIMQRLGKKDLSGVIEELKLPYLHVMLPMRFEIERACATPIGKDWRKREGELLFPERFPAAVLDRDEKAMTAYSIASQHQQRPTPRGGLLFKRHWFKVVQAVPMHCRFVRGWDLAASETLGSAFTAGCLIAHDIRAKHYYIVNVVRARVSNPEPMIVNTASQDLQAYGPVEISVPQDPGASGKIQGKSIGIALSGYSVSVSPESGDKVSRATPVASQAEIGNMSIVAGEWNNDFLDEIETFPTGYMDQVDALSRAFGKMIMSGGVMILGPVVASKPINHFGSMPSE